MRPTRNPVRATLARKDRELLLLMAQARIIVAEAREMAARLGIDWAAL